MHQAEAEVLRSIARGKACPMCPAKEPATRNLPPLTPLDPSLTLTRTQYPAKVGKSGNKKRLTYAEFASPCNAQQPQTAHS
jgi:hypothetical protein